MSPVSHGADPAALREAAQQLTASSRSLDEMVTTGHAMGQVLTEAWSGPDLDTFVGHSWPTASQRLAEGSQLLQAMSTAAVRNADEQESTSEGSGPGRSGGASGTPGRSGGPGGANPGGSSDAGQSRDADDYGELPPGVRAKWGTYDEDQKRAIIEQIIKERAEHYGIDMPDINWDDDMSGNGALLDDWWMSDEVYINPDMLDDPMILHTAFHEMRHAGQHEGVDDADTFWPWEDPEYNDGMTPEEVAEWKENFDNYESAPSQEDWDEDPEAAQEQYDRYFEQPVEVDAREEGSDFVEGMTPEELDRLLEASDD